MRCWVGALAGALLFFASDPAGAVKIRISHHYDDVTDARGRATRIFAQEAQLLAPSLEFSIHPKLSLGYTSKGQLDALQAGKLEMTLLPFTYAAEKIPEASLALLPGLVPNIELAQRLKSTAFYDRLQAIAEANGMHIVTWWWAPGGFATKARAVHGPESVAGLKMRAADPIFERMLQAAGATTANTPLPGIRAAVEQGKLDGLLTAYESFVALGLGDHLKFATVGSPTIWMLFQPLLISKRTWDALSGEERAAIESAAAIAEAYFDGTQRDAERRLVALAQRQGVSASQLTQADYDAWLDLARRTAWADYVRQSPEAERLLFDTMQTIIGEFYQQSEDAKPVARRGAETR